MTELAFVTGPGQTGSPRDLVEALVATLGDAGTDAIVVEQLTSVGSRVPVLVGPAAFAHGLAGRPSPPGEVLARSICLCVEPGDVRWAPAVSVAGACGTVFTLGEHHAFALRQADVAAEALTLGAHAAWDAPPAGERDLDVLFVGAVDPRRAHVLARCADVLARHRARLVLIDPAPTNPTDAWPAGAERRDLLARSRTVLVLGREGDDELAGIDLVWATQAVQNGCAIVAEHGPELPPLRGGETLVTARGEAIPHVLSALLADESRRAGIAGAARTALRETTPTVTERLLAAAQALVDRHGPPEPVPLRSARLLDGSPGVAGGGSADALPAIARGLKDVRGRLRALDRRMTRERIERDTGRPAPAAVEVARSPAWDAGAARVSIVVPVYQHAQHLAAALDSAHDSRYRDLELVIVDDGSGDGSAEAGARWIADHPDVPALVVRHPVNRGLPAARNTALAFARGELAFMLDADNAIFAHGLGRLVDALDADPGATFAYGIVQRYDAYGPRDLVSMYPWAPERLRMGNDIDAMALVRTRELRELGGYADAPPFDGGWEDYELWCRIASAGRRAAFVPEIVGRYLVDPGSLLGLTNLSLDDVAGALVERYPALMGASPR